jgi:hypothetical protein
MVDEDTRKLLTDLSGCSSLFIKCVCECISYERIFSLKDALPNVLTYAVSREPLRIYVSEPIRIRGVTVQGEFDVPQEDVDDEIRQIPNATDEDMDHIKNRIIEKYRNENMERFYAAHGFTADQIVSTGRKIHSAMFTEEDRQNNIREAEQARLQRTRTSTTTTSTSSPSRRTATTSTSSLSTQPTTTSTSSPSRRTTTTSTSSSSTQTTTSSTSPPRRY